MSITKTALVQEYGAYYLNNGQNLTRLKKLMLFGAETKKICTQIMTDETVYRMAQSKFTSVIQSFQKGWTPKGDVEFAPNSIELHKVKVDIEVYPDDIEETWLGFLAGQVLTRKDWPLIRFLLESHIYEQIQADMENKELYGGVYTAPTAGTAGITGQSINGIKKNLKKANVNHDTTVGALDASTIYDQFEKAFELVSEVYKTQDLMLCTSPTWARAFLKDKRSLGYYTISGAGQIDNTIDFSKAAVIGLPSMLSTNDWFITPKGNLLDVIKRGENAGKVNIEESKRCVNIMTDWSEGIGFGINEIVWTNVAAE